MDRLRLASLQYFIRPVQKFEQFQDQVDGLVKTAVDYKCQLVVFPEYFTLQLLTLGNVKKPMQEQVRDLAKQVPRFLEMISTMAKENHLYIVAGSIPVFDEEKKILWNESYFFGPTGKYGRQGKLHMTRFEREEWIVSPHEKLQVFETDFGRMGIAICYDVEFPEIARAAARLGANVLIIPSCTDDRQGYLRVRYCAQARAIENHMYTIIASTVGSLPMVPAVSLNYGQAAILTPSDFPFSRDGILSEGSPNLESMVIGELNLHTIMESLNVGTVLPLQDSQRTAAIVSSPEVITI